MKIAISGVGLRSVKVLSYIRKAMPEVEFVGYFDPQPTLLPELCDPGSIRRFASIEEMLTETAADMLFVGSPNHFHLEQIEIGLKAGVRVFCEKPVVTTLEDTWALARLLRDYGSDRVMVGLVLRYAPQMNDLRRAMKAGALGDIVSMEASEHIEPAHGGFFMRDWRRRAHYSGGFMLEKCVHDIDLYNMIAGSRPVRVASFGGRRTFLPANAPAKNSNMEIYHRKRSIWDNTDDPFASDGDIIDFQTAIIAYENGASLAFHTNLNVPDEQRRFLIIGTRGIAEGDFQRGYLKITQSPSGQRLEDIDYSSRAETQIDHYGADAQMGRDIAAYLRGERAQLPVSIVDALEAGIVAMAIDEARFSGQVVDMAQSWEKFDSFGLRR